MASGSWVRRWVPVFAFVLVVGVFFGFFFGSGTIQLALRGVEGTGIVDSKPDLIKDSQGDYYRAWVVYEYPAGETHRGYIRLPPNVRQGSEIFILFDPEDPTNVDWRPKSDHVASVIIFPALGVLMIGYLGYAIVKQRRRSA